MKINSYNFLASTYMFGHLSPEAISMLAEEASEIHLTAGECLIQQGEVGDCLYVLCYGRLLVFHESGETSRFLGEVFPRETVGEMALLGEKIRSSYVIASRNSTMISISIDTFERVIKAYPEIGIKLAQLIVKRTQKSLNSVTENRITTITVIPTSNDPQFTGLASRVEAILAKKYHVIRITKTLVVNNGLDYRNETSENLIEFFSENELNHEFVIYDCEQSDERWKNLCIHQSDCLLLFDDDTGSQHTEFLNKLGFPRVNIHVPIYLACIHPSHTLVNIPQIHPSVAKVSHLTFSDPETFERLIRVVTGHTFGVLLGGGGASGFAHIGVLRAFEEYNISIDVIAGVSSGSIIAAQYAMGLSAREILEANKLASALAAKYMRHPSIPIISLYSNKKFKKYLSDFFNDMKIENLWRNYFAISCDLSLKKLHAHDRGLLHEAVYASNAIVPLIPPAVKKGHLYVDGGYINTVPGDIFREHYHGIILGVDVAKEDNFYVNPEWINYPSNAEILWKRINPFAKKISVSGMVDLMLRAMSLGRNINIKNTQTLFDHYLVPPVDHIGFLDFSKINVLEEIGYEYAREQIESWHNQFPY